MQVWHYRPAFLCCSAFMGAAALGLFLPAAWKWVAVALLAVGALIAIALLLARRRDGYHAILTGAAVCLAVLALVQSYFTFDGGAEVERLRAAEGQNLRVEGVITERRGSGGSLSSFTVKLNAVGGEPVDGLALLTCYYTSDLQAGFAVDMECTVLPLEEVAWDGYDAVALMGDGYRIGLNSMDETSVTITDENAGGVSVAAIRLRQRLVAKLNLWTGEGSHGLPAALLLGDRSDLDLSVRRDFARAGVSHLLAISGLHMTLLFGLLEAILRLCRVPKRARAVVLGMGGMGYLFMLGFPPSATRAVIMLGLTYLSYLCSTRTDPLTSLGVAGVLILTVSPHAVADAGFWMSFLATFGLLAVMPLITELWLKPPKKPLPAWLSAMRAGAVKIAAGLLVGVVAMTFTLFITASVIGQMGVLSPVSTLLLTPLCGVILVASVLLLPLGGTPLGGLLTVVIETVSGWMADLAATLAEPSWVVMSLKHPAILPIALVMTAVLFLLLGIRLAPRRRWLVLLPILVGWVAVGGVAAMDGGLPVENIPIVNDAVPVDRTVTTSYLQPSSISDGLVAVSGRYAVICDLSDGSKKALYAAVTEAEELGATEISALILTHYHSRHTGTLTDLLARETIRTLWLPEPADEDDRYLMEACLEKAEAAGVPTVIYQTGEPLTVTGWLDFSLETAYLERSVQPVLLLRFEASAADQGDETAILVYCGSSVFESDLSARATALVAEADAVIFGHHGPLVKAPFGGELTYRDGVSVTVSVEGDEDKQFDRSALPEGTTVFVGPRRVTLP